MTSVHIPTEPGSARVGRFGARAALAMTALTLAAVPFGLLVTLVRSHWAPLQDLDVGASEDLHRYALAHSAFVTAMETLSVLGSSVVYVPLFLLVAGLLVWRSRRRLAVFVAVTVAGSWLLNTAVKVLVGRTRPALPDPVAVAGGASFPSGHAQAAMTNACVLLVVLLPVVGRGWRWPLGVFLGVGVLAIGFSRIALGVHYLSDVVGGFVLGAAWAAATAAAFTVWHLERARALRGRAASGRRSPQPKRGDRERGGSSS